MNKQIDETNEQLAKVLTELQLSVNNCSTSINNFIEAYENKVSGEEDAGNYNVRNLTSHSAIQTLESLQEIRKVIIKKKKLFFLYKENFKGPQIELDKWAELEKEILSENKYQDFIKITELSPRASNYDSFSIRSNPSIEIKKVNPPSPWISKNVSKN